jgi:hypothetical protein
MAEDHKDKQNDPKDKTRFYTEKGGVKRKIVDTYYDTRQNCVFDVYEVTRIIRNSEKKSVQVTTLRRAYSQDESLQKKYRIDKDSPRVEVKIHV